jgi:hypothetical protein
MAFSLYVSAQMGRLLSFSVYFKSVHAYDNDVEAVSGWHAKAQRTNL